MTYLCGLSAREVSEGYTIISSLAASDTHVTCGRQETRPVGPEFQPFRLTIPGSLRASPQATTSVARGRHDENSPFEPTPTLIVLKTGPCNMRLRRVRYNRHIASLILNTARADCSRVNNGIVRISRENERWTRSTTVPGSSVSGAQTDGDAAAVVIPRRGGDSTWSCLGLPYRDMGLEVAFRSSCLIS